MFRGVKTLTIDAKHRIAMPMAFREKLVPMSGGQLVANVDLNQPKCLVIYPTPVWEDVEQRIQERLPNAGAKAKILRYLLSNASDVDLDASGKMLIPQNLREHINLEKSVVLVGVGKKFELWREDDWKEEQSAGREETMNVDLVAEVVSDIGFI